MVERLDRHPFLLAAVFSVYFGLGILGLGIGGVQLSATAVWPPSGFALAALLLFGRGLWRAVFAGAFFVYFLTGGELFSSLALAVGNTLEAIVGSMLVERLAGGRDAFRSARTVFRFAVVAIVSTGITATLGALSVTLVNRALGDFAFTWLTWWLGNLTGTLVIAPVVLLWTTTPFERPADRRLPRRVCRTVPVGHQQLSARVPVRAVLPVGRVPLRPARGRDRARGPVGHCGLGHGPRRGA